MKDCCKVAQASGYPCNTCAAEKEPSIDALKREILLEIERLEGVAASWVGKKLRPYLVELWSRQNTREAHLRRNEHAANRPA